MILFYVMMIQLIIAHMTCNDADDDTADTVDADVCVCERGNVCARVFVCVLVCACAWLCACV